MVQSNRSLVSPDFTATAKSFFAEISFFVKTFFFVYLGLIIDFSNYQLIILGFLITVLFLLVRPITLKLLRLTSVPKKDMAFMQTLVPKGLAAAVLAQLPLLYVADNPALLPKVEQFSTIVLSVIMFSILFSTIGVYMTEKGKFSGFDELLDLRKQLEKIKKMMDL